MVFLWIFCFAFAGAAYGCGTPAIPPDISGYSDIVNGKEAVPHSWPWQVYLQTRVPEGYRLCGGSLINERWVVTAAHCNAGRSTRVVLGAHDLSSRTEKVQVMKVDKVFTHPRYNKPTRFNNDIQLIKLTSPAQMNRHVSPVCVAETGDNFPAGITCMATGWGLTSDGKTATRLQQAALRLVSNRQCRQVWGRSITSKMICDGGNRAATCSGDSGGPLVCQKAGVWTLVGIVSWGDAHCNPMKPSVNARVTALRAWMDRTIAAN